MSNFYEIPGYPRFKISEDGRIYDCKFEKELERHVTKDTNIPHVNVKYVDGFKRLYIIPLYALAFVEKPQDVENSKLIAVFKDGDKRVFSKDSIIWTTQSEHQTEKFKQRIEYRRKQFNLPDFKNNPTLGMYPNPIECKEMPGYYYIPTILEPVVINEEGKVYDLYRRQYKTLTVSYKGYVNVSLLGIDYNNTHKPIHRLLGYLFKEIPDRHKNKNISLLQVNHVDGIKEHNYPSNLEWTDGQENMNHARDNGLFSNQLEVAARNYITSEEVKFRSISKAAEWLKVPVQSLYTHLNSEIAGKLLYDGYQLKYTDNLEWQEPFDLISKDDRFRYSGHIFVKNVNTSKVTVFNNFKEACEYFNMTPHIVKNHRQRNGKLVPYQNLIFLVDKEFYNGVV